MESKKLSAWDDSAVLVITPDAFRRGLGSRVVDEILALGLDVTGSRLVRPGMLELDALYEDVVANDGQWRTYRYRCVDYLFALGTSLAVVLHRPPGLSLPGGLHEFLQDYKGSGPLHEASPDCLRRRLSSVNSILSLIHTSASPAEAELDMEIFGRRNWLTTAPHMPREGHDLVPLDPGVAARMLDSTLPETRDFDEVLVDLRARILIHCWEVLSPYNRDHIEREVGQHGRAALLDHGVVRSSALELGAQGAHGLAEGLAAPFRPGAQPVDTERLWPTLSASGVDTDPWERAVLSTSQYFAPVTTLPSLI